jgi:hypothetical protein
VGNEKVRWQMVTDFGHHIFVPHMDIIIYIASSFRLFLNFLLVVVALFLFLRYRGYGLKVTGGGPLCLGCNRITHYQRLA